MRVKKRGQDLAVHVLHNVLQTACMLYSVFSCWNVLILIFLVFMCIIGSKRVVFEGGSRGPPPELFKQYSYKMEPFYAINIFTVLNSSDNNRDVYIVHKFICVSVLKWDTRTLMLKVNASEESQKKN